MTEMPAPADLRRHAVLHVGRLHAEARAVAGRHLLREAAGDHPGKIGEVEPGARVLVHMKVDRPPELRRQLQANLHMTDRVGVDVRSASDHVDPELERPSQPGPVVGARGIGEWVAQSHHLQVNQPPQPIAYPYQRVGRSQLDSLTYVYMGADGGDSSRERDLGGTLGAPSDVVDGELPPVLVPCLDGRPQVTRLHFHARGGERLVEMRMRLRGCGQQHVAGRIELAQQHVGETARGVRRRADPHAVPKGRPRMAPRSPRS